MPALKGTFAADFTPFYDAVQKADASLKDFESGAGRVGTSLDNMVNRFSGKKILEDAALMEKAFSELSKQGIGLTTAELERMGRTATEATEKMRAMGIEVPPGLQKIADATKAVEKEIETAQKQTTDWGGMLKGLAASVGIGFSVSAIMQFGASVVEAGSQINDMSERLGISTDAVQGFKYAAEQAGSNLDAVGNALGKMSEKLAGGDKPVVKALADLHLKFNDIRSMKPEDAFLAITDALQATTDPMEQMRLGTILMGKGFKEILPAVTEGFRATANSATKMSADAVKACDQVGDAWNRLSTNVKAKSAEIISYTLDATKQATQSWAGFVQFLDNAIKMGVGPALALNAAMEKANRALKENHDINLTLPGPIHKTKEELDAAAAAAKKYADEFKAMVDKFSGAAATSELNMLDAVYKKLSASGKLTAEGTAELAKQATELFKAGGTLTPRLLDLVIKFGDLDPKVKEGTAEFEHLGTTIQTLTMPAMVAINAEIDALQKKTTAGFSGFAEMGLKVGDGFKEGAKVIDDNAKKIEDAFKRDQKAIGEMAQAFGQLGSIANSTGHAIAGSMFSSLGGLTNNLKTAQEQNAKWKDSSGGVAAALFSSQSSATEKMASAVQSGAAIAGGAMNVWAATANAGGKAAGAFKGAMAGAEAGAAFGPWGAAVGAAAGALTGFIRNLTAGRKAVEDFATTEGGFDALHDKLNALPTGVGETLWKNLTQGTAKGDPKAAQAAIDKIKTALADADAKTAAFNTSVSGIFAKMQSYGGGVSSALAPMLADLQKGKQLSDENLASLQAMGTSGKPTYEQLDSLAKKYNLTIDQMGSGFQASKINDEFQTLVDDMDEMQRGGVDMNAVLTQTGTDGVKSLSDLGTQVQTVIDQSQKYGVAIPENMKPAAQSMIDQGLLLDANGQKVKDINQLKFGESMQTSLDGLNDTLKTLIQTLTGAGPNSVKGALETLGKTVVSPTIKPTLDTSGLPSGASTPAPDWGGAQASGGDYWVTKPTMFLAGEAGPERATFGPASSLVRQRSAAPAGGAIVTNQPIIVQVDGMKLLETVATTAANYGVTRQ
jgi:hypothetical protein